MGDVTIALGTVSPGFRYAIRRTSWTRHLHMRRHALTRRSGD